MSGWLFDLGNTRLKAAPLGADGAVGEVVSFPHDGKGFAPGWADALPRIDVAWVASVAGATLRAALLDALAARAGRISIVRTSRRWGPLQVAYAEPARLGVDRFLAMLAAQAGAAGEPVLLCSVGTALTIDLLDADGRHLGGRIAPSPTLMRQALHARAPQLPDTGGEYRDFADDTGDALASGCEGAAAGLITDSLSAATARLGREPRLLLHGGGAPALQPRLPSASVHSQLVLDGLARWVRDAAAG